MKFSVDRLILCEAVNNLSKTVSTRSSVPVLEGIKFEIENNLLKMTTYNFEIGMTKEIQIKSCEEPGSIVINAKLLSEMIRRFSGNIVHFECDERYMCKITSGSAIYEIMGMTSEDFPDLPFFDDGKGVEIDSEIFKNIVKQSIFSAAVGEVSKPVLTGEYFEFKENEISVTAVDGYRLAIRKEKTKNDNLVSFIVPAKTINEIVKLITEKEKTIKMNVGKRFMSVNIDGYNLISRLMEGEYINFSHYISGNYSSKIKIDTREIIQIIERISLLIDEQINTPVKCKITQNSLEFSCKTTLGSAFDSYECEQIEGEKLEIGFKSRYLIDALKATETDQVILNLNGVNKPIIITPVEGDSFLYMIMPMRL
ncbi:MAG: DNA polymerase III subunit beta [bacterium]|nr:DNA polymerase III subunit beta [bacterium]